MPALQIIGFVMRKNNGLMLMKTVERFQSEYVLFIIHLLNLLVHKYIAELGSFASVQQIYVNLILRRTQIDICLIQS